MTTIGPRARVASDLVDLVLEAPVLDRTLLVQAGDIYEKQGISKVDAITIDLDLLRILAANLDRGPAVVASAIAAAFSNDPALNQRIRDFTAAKATAAAEAKKNAEAATARERLGLLEELTTRPASKKGFPAAVLTLVARGEVSLDQVSSSVEALASRGWDRAALESGVAQAVVRGVNARDYSLQKKMQDQTHAFFKKHPEGSLTTAIAFACLDYCTIQGNDAPSVMIGDSKFVPSQVFETYLKDLASRVPADSAAGPQAAAGLHRLSFGRWCRNDAYITYLESSAAASAAKDALTAIFNDPSRFVTPAGRGFANANGALYFAQGGADNSIVRHDAAGTQLFAKTGRWASQALQVCGAEVFSLSSNNDVCYLEVFGRDNGQLLRRVTLPRPIHHVSWSRTALTNSGHLVYGSTDYKSLDTLVVLDPQFDGKDAKRAEHLKRVTTEAPKGYKLKGVAAEGDHVFVAMVHDAKRTLRVVRYDSATLQGAVDVLAEPLCLSGHGWDGQIALRDDRILLLGGAVTYVYERTGENARFVRAIPTTIHDMIIGSDGHADVVVGARDGDKTKSVVVRLSKQEVDGAVR